MAKVLATQCSLYAYMMNTLLTLASCNILETSCNDPEFSDKQVLANSVDADQIAYKVPEGAV